MKWISVEDEFPERNKPVLCYTDQKEVHVGKYVKNSFWVVGGHFEWDIGKPTHWQPLPEPPK